MKIKIFTLLIFPLLASIHIFCQPTINYQKVVGGGTNDQLSCSYLTSDGGIILGGSSISYRSGDKTKSSRYFDFWIVKQSRHHKIEWDKTIRGNNYDYLNVVKQTADGGYILGGTSASDKGGDKTARLKGAYDYWIVRLDSAGNIKWDKTYGGSKNDALYSILETDDGGYILGGASSTGISEDKTQASKGGSDYWIIKIDASGTIEWDKTIGGRDDDLLRVVQKTNDGGYILGGTSGSGISGDKTSKSEGYDDFWIVKVDEAGNIEWDKTFGGKSYDALYDLHQTNDGGYILGGESSSNATGSKTHKSKGGSDFWILKLDDTGNTEWDKTIGGIQNDYCLSIIQTYDAGYIAGGYSYSGNTGDKTEASNGGSDYWVVKLDKNGKVDWDKTIGGSSEDVLVSIKEIKKNRYTLSGYSTSVISGDKTEMSKGEYDYWLLYLNYSNPLNQAVNNFSSKAQTITNGFIVYPNPANDILHVQTKNKTVITITNQSGKVVLTKVIAGHESIDLSKLTTGIYYVKDANTGASHQINIIE